MKEIVFVHENSPKWKDFENKLQDNEGKVSEDISKLYIQVTDDLSYANTFFPGTETSAYLNQLALKVHQHVYRTRKEKKNIIVTFWKYSFPALVYKYRRLVYYSAFIFLTGALIGALSSRYDNTFVRLIMGDRYMDLTESNIGKNDPFAIYKMTNQSDMFFKIAANNIRVGIMCFVSGILLIIGSGYILLSNGIMLGTFHYFWFDNGYFELSLRTVFLHGTLEIFSIILTGTAGILIGHSFLFPGTYKRIESLKRGSRHAVKIVVGTVPLFVVAALIESFVTRHYQMPLWLSVGIIAASSLFITYYFFIYPRHLTNTNYEKQLY